MKHLVIKYQVQLYFSTKVIIHMTRIGAALVQRSSSIQPGLQSIHEHKHT